MTFTTHDILTLPHLQALGFGGKKGVLCKGVCTDSRTVQRDDLFIAIRGEKFDGHNFITKAVESGASAIAADARWAEANQILLSSLNLPCLIVEDTIRLLGQVATMHRRKFRIPVLVVGGSNGKTTTKEMIAVVLKAKYRVLHTEGNLNNHIGVPQTLLRLDRQHQVAVIEIGTNHFGEIAYLASVAEPTHAIITNVGREHLEFFGSVAGVARAEAEVFDWMRKRKGSKGVGFVNRDDQHLAKLARGLKKAVTYGFGKGTLAAKGKLLGFNELAFPRIEVKPRGKKALRIDLSVPGEHNASNALAAATVGLALGVPAKKIQAALSSFSSASKRMQLFQINGVTVLNDTYNSNPDSALAALGVLGRVKSTGKKIAVLADMLELGSNAEREHQRIGAAVAGAGATHLLGFGPLTKHTVNAAATGFKKHFELKNALSEQLAQLLVPGDVVLVKGSRGMRMEEVVAFISERLKQSQYRPYQAA
jgi:UDP-N-acetylmuramoyl-tripeptide--D-alanyl-D-alanine ligase